MRLARKQQQFTFGGTLRTIAHRGFLALALTAAVLPLLFISGCAGIVSGQSSNTQNVQTYTITGVISPIAGGSGATVKLGGAASATVTADGSGNFAFTGLPNGTYTVTPSHAGYTFNPTSLNVTINNADVTSGVSFTATATNSTFSISGSISPVTGGSGATVTLSGAANATVTADASGNFSFTGLVNGSFTVTPTHAGYTFSPASRNVTINNANVTSGVTFTATATNSTFSISGTISPVTGGSGSTVTLSGAAAATTIADASGNYTFTGLANGVYAITPSHAGYAFSPTSGAATVSGANVTGINFTATATNPTFSISGTISPVAGGAGATVALTGPAAATATANASGNYTFTGLANGTYTITPTNAGYTFAPATQNATVNSANVTGINFSATAQSFTVALSWDASTSTVSGYNIYRSTTSGSGYAKLNTTLLTTLTYTDSTVVNGTTYFYVATAVDASGNESVDSNEASAIVP